MKMLRYKFFGFILGSFAVYLVLFYSLYDKFSNIHTETVVNLKHVVVHIDLKGAPVKLDYLESLLPLFKRYGVNGLLMEYEDMFPYDGPLVNLSARNCYDKEELRKFITKAVMAEIEIIPLVQTFGHMEHVLKLEEFQTLRELPAYPDSICPSNSNSIQLLADMLSQVIKFHLEIAPVEHIHIGCDEVFHINRCQKCVIRQISKTDLLIYHVAVMKDIIKGISKSTEVLIWDDMFRSIKYRWNVNKHVDISNIGLVYWDYTPDLSVSHRNLYNYHNSFDSIWIGTAFKGADGKHVVLPNLRDRFLNHYMWMNLILDYVFAGETKVYNFKGIILTGWSRYSHMDPICELLPVSLPSLMLNLLLVQKFRSGITYSDALKSPYEFFNKHLMTQLNRDLKCSNVNDVGELPGLLDTCGFESSAFYVLLKQYQLLASDINSVYNHEGLDLLALDFSYKINNINMHHVKRNVEWCNSTLKEIDEWISSIRREMGKYYDKPVIEEFIEQKMMLPKSRVLNTIRKLNNYSRVRIWDRRPYEFLTSNDNVRH